MSTMPVDFRVLGPLEAGIDGESITPRGPKLRVLLAVLLTHSNEVTSAGRLIDALWDSRPPASAHGTLRSHACRLRHMLSSHENTSRFRRAPESMNRFDGCRLVAVPSGYRLLVEPDELDLHRFDALTDQARALVRRADLRGADLRLRQALALWRGRALEGIASQWLQRTVVPSLQERRMAALEEHLRINQRLGRHQALITELTPLLPEYPFREWLHGQLMVALCCDGRQTEALAVFRQLRRLLRDKQGVEPGARIQRLHQAVLSGATGAELAATLDTPASAVEAGSRTGGAASGFGPRERSRLALAQLPRDTPTLVGRDADLAWLCGRLAADAGPSTVVCAIDGPAGVGKSALALHVAHRVRRHFPDGQLYVNLLAASPGCATLHARDVLRRFLADAGLAFGRESADLQSASARFRSALDGRRVLIVLDDAANATQVRPLLPASPGCAALITSRRVLATLDGVDHLHLGVLPASSATALLLDAGGVREVEPVTAARLARLCGYLPLALRIATARLAAEPRLTMEALANRIESARHPLDELQLADLSVRASIDVSYHALAAEPGGREACRLLRRIGAHDHGDLTVSTTAALAGCSAQKVEPLLDQLVAAQLLEYRSAGWYRLNEFVGWFTRQRADE